MELPLANPPIRGFLRWAYTLAITCAYPETEHWLYNNFVQLACTTGYSLSAAPGAKRMVLDFWRGPDTDWVTSNPFLVPLVTSYTSGSSGLRAEDITEFSADSLARGHYPILFVDECKIPGTQPYRSGVSLPHHLLLWSASGTDTFGAFGYVLSDVPGSLASLQRFTVSGQDLRAAALSVEKLVQSGSAGDEFTVQMRYRTINADNCAVDVSPRLDLIKAAMTSYITGSELPTLTPPRSGCYVFGHHVYEEFGRYILSTTDPSAIMRYRQDVRHLQILEEHCDLMIRRLNWAARFLDSHEHLEAVALFAAIGRKLRGYKIRHLMRGPRLTIEGARRLATELTQLGLQSRIAMEAALAFLELW